MNPPINRLVFVSVTPSPYQRDLFAALARRGRIELRVYYQERTPPDSPWPETPLEPYESILPGFVVNWRGGRSHFNSGLHAPRPGEFWIVNGSMTDATTQLLMRRLAGGTPWAFWGELPSSPRTRWRKLIQSWQYRPLRSARQIAAVGQRAVCAYQKLVPDVPVANRPYACDLSAFSSATARPASADGPVFLFC